MNFHQICQSHHDSLSRSRVSNSVPTTPESETAAELDISSETLPPLFANDFHPKKSPTLPELQVGKKRQTSTVLEHVLISKMLLNVSKSAQLNKRLQAPSNFM